ncbi:MAG TPA: pilus assembly protein TadG-related protein [Gaiellaceae bacterium]|jgi:Flp pilus assembly protein TadG|nr:pilus assembly protein TadG-related protein [Gaiellaceae bacterium]
MRARLQSESGQAMLVSVLFLVAVIGAVALTVDIGAWYRQQRQAQAVADAAALAGAQALPASTSQAITWAQQYGTANGGGITPGGITFRSDYEPNDTVVVNVARTSPGFFAKLFSINAVTTHATASARAGVPDQVSGAGPIVVNKLHPMLSGPGCPCFHVETTLPLAKDGAPGAFGLVNLDPNASNGVPNLASWIQYGFNGYLPLGKYNSDPGAKFNSNNVRDALSARIGTELLFPVYDTLTGNGANAAYNVIGWVAFHLDGFPPDKGNNFQLQGYFTRVIWDGLQSSTNKHLPDFGVYSVSLVN